MTKEKTRPSYFNQFQRSSRNITEPNVAHKIEAEKLPSRLFSGPRALFPLVQGTTSKWVRLVQLGRGSVDARLSHGRRRSMPRERPELLFLRLSSLT